MDIENPQDRGPLYDAPLRPLAEDSSEIDDRASRARAGDCIQVTGFLAMRSGDPMAANAVYSASRLPRRDHFDECWRLILQAEQEGRGPMGDDGFRSTGESGRQHPTAVADCLMSDRECIPKDAMEVTSGQQAPNRAIRDPEGAYLSTRDNPMLPSRKLRQPVVLSSVSFARYADISHRGSDFAPWRRRALGRCTL